MRTISDKELREIVEKHGKWLRGEDGGPRAPEGWGACPRDSDGLGYPFIRIHMVR